MLNKFTEKNLRGHSTTELLCNLMRFAAFRNPVLAHLLLGSSCVDSIEFDDIDTQITLTGSGRPDLVIYNDKIYALVEIKTEKSRGLTDHQPDSYFDHLLKETARERWLVFLVPDG